MLPVPSIVKATTSLLSFNRIKPCLDLGTVAADIEQATPSNSVLTTTCARETVDYYDRDDIKVGKVLRTGHFYEYYKVKRLPDQDASENSSAGSGYESDNENNTVATKRKQAPYAVKQLHRKIFTTYRNEPKMVQQAALRLVLEAKYLSRLNHPNIVAAKGLPFGEELVLQQGSADCFFIVEPRMVETLEDRIARWRHYQGERKAEVETFEPTSVMFQRKLGYAKDLASALQYLHEKNIVLLNLNPQTVGFLQSGTLQITDLSCCQEVEATSKRAPEFDEKEMTQLALAYKTRTTDVTTNYLLHIAADDGVPRHVAPEAILQDQYTPKADTYSWSLVLFELVTLSQPYIAYKAGHHLMKVCVEGQRPHLSTYGLPRELKKLLCRTWSQAPSKRLDMSQVLAAIPSP